MKFFKIFLLAAMCLNFAGCFQAESNLTISESGAVTMRNKFIGTPYIVGIIEEFKINLLKNNPDAKIKPVTEGGYSGYEIEIFYPDMEKFAANDFELFQARPGKCTGVQISNGWFYNSYSFDLLFEGRKDIDTSNLGAAMAQAVFSDIKFDFVVNLPYAAEITNADFMSNDGKILTWNIAPALINGQNKSMQFNFRIYNTTRIATTFFLALIIIAGVILNLSQAKNRGKGKELREEGKNL